MFEPTVAEMVYHEGSVCDLLWRFARHPEIKYRSDIGLMNDLSEMFAWASTRRREAGQPGWRRYEQIHHALRLKDVNMLPKDLLYSALRPTGGLVYEPQTPVKKEDFGPGRECVPE